MDATTTQIYISLLEKTNQQLSLWSNPYGVMVAVLSFLVAFLAVAAAVILYRQSREYRDLYQEALKNYEVALQNNLKTIGLNYQNRVDELIESKTKEIDTFSGDAKNKAKTIIQDLKKEKESIGSKIQLSSLESGRDHLNSASLIKFPLDNKIWLSGSQIFENTKSEKYCPNCGTFFNVTLNTNYCSSCGSKL